ncbi:Bro-N domain-containing protein [Pasteurella multocida]|uniref:BRO-N domain-containing protein n=2 Tax=Pasteurella multocida TaxID=747 RepID=UPI0029A1AE9D|nr:BRO family protein [Pasteurella multocida]MDX3890465.1 BRO family protein [Pasteurella multocida]MDX3892871.1 BRO family protein [Pasteurella multocida]MDX3898854.1 BRO family protein [Pasteurella multocida]MDX3952435.1 BRO family protein [Pasteurella multocida]MDX3956536.1 BRO family protein [Pasteurella multocida]
MSKLTFQNTALVAIQRNNQTYISASDLAKALQYADVRAISKIYNRNEDEFAPDMTLVVKLTTKGFGNGNSEKEVRIFSLRGCHLIAMFARTPIAKEFRKWVLDILDRETNKPQQLTLPEPKPRGILLDEEAFYVVAKAIAKLNESTFEWEKMMDLFSELESHRNYKTAFNLGVASYNLAQSSEKIIMKNLVQMRNKVWKKEIEDFIFSNPHLQNHTENKLVHYLR